MKKILARLLIVEDDRFLHEMMKQKFVKEKFQTISAFSGKEAKVKFEREKPDLVLLDLLLPEMDGVEVLTFIKKESAYPKTPVLIVTNYSDHEKIQTVRDLGAIDYIIKAHFRPDEIVTKVKEILSIP